MDILAFIPLIIYILICIGLGAIPGIIAKRKHRNRAMWWVAGAFGFPIALICILCFRDLDQIPEDKKVSSKLKEKIILVAILVLWVVMILSRIKAVN
ncbi:MAG: hypothetical protein ABIK92_16245 [Pseudomonadota bacterium]